MRLHQQSSVGGRLLRFSLAFERVALFTLRSFAEAIKHVSFGTAFSRFSRSASLKPLAAPRRTSFCWCSCFASGCDLCSLRATGMPLLCHPTTSYFVLRPPPSHFATLAARLWLTLAALTLQLLAVPLRATTLALRCSRASARDCNRARLRRLPAPLRAPLVALSAIGLRPPADCSSLRSSLRHCFQRGSSYRSSSVSRISRRASDLNRRCLSRARVARPLRGSLRVVRLCLTRKQRG